VVVGHFLDMVEGREIRQLPSVVVHLLVAQVDLVDRHLVG
jgi:hypothetical protein